MRLRPRVSGNRTSSASGAYARPAGSESSATTCSLTVTIRVPLEPRSIRPGPSRSESTSAYAKAQRSGDPDESYPDEPSSLAPRFRSSRSTRPVVGSALRIVHETDRPAAPACGRPKSIDRSPRKTWGVVRGNGPITRHSRIGSNRARTRSSDSAASPENSPERAAAASCSGTRSRIASRADSAARRSRGSRSATRYSETACGSASRHSAAIARVRSAGSNRLLSAVSGRIASDMRKATTARIAASRTSRAGSSSRSSTACRISGGSGRRTFRLSRAAARTGAAGFCRNVDNSLGGSSPAPARPGNAAATSDGGAFGS